MAKKGLGQGLDSIFTNDLYSSIDEIDEKNFSELKISEIEPNINQPRKYFDKDEIKSLSDSISEYGLLQPILVTQNSNNTYTIVAGERRWRAAKQAGLKSIPVIIRKYSSQEIAEISLIENIQREDLNPIEEALAYKSLLDQFDLTQEMVSVRIGKSRSAIANSLRLLSLDNSIQKLVASGDISGGHARAILSINDIDLQKALAKRIIEDGLNVRQTEVLSKQLQKTPKRNYNIQKSAYDIQIEDITNKLSSQLGTKVKISHGAKKGKIEIEYYSDSDLERLLDIFNI